MEAAIMHSAAYQKSVKALFPEYPPDVTPQRDATATYHLIRHTLEEWWNLWAVTPRGFLHAPQHLFERMERSKKAMLNWGEEEDPRVQVRTVERLRSDLGRRMPMRQDKNDETRQLGEYMFIFLSSLSASSTLKLVTTRSNHVGCRPKGHSAPTSTAAGAGSPCHGRGRRLAERMSTLFALALLALAFSLLAASAGKKSYRRGAAPA